MNITEQIQILRNSGLQPRLRLKNDFTPVKGDFAVILLTIFSRASSTRLASHNANSTYSLELNP